ncbi:OLC1v1032199C1 [Oldenlandia corymbosa var. corymbosa]|uniref:OLC1v1032199C1 n=1 Tax=Oldenlandia corymbosa var. corymbosa TaxID=529605 RepID=A0AAV1CMB6_OLDCO|nr:OLC1v1032199C1 [Oldenlandia corymbosa var. corymbosa]
MENENLTSTELHGGIPQSSSSESLFLNHHFDGRDFTSETEMMLMMSRSLRQQQELMDRENAVLTNYLKETVKQAQALRQENVNLKMVNSELTNRLTLLMKAVSDYGLSSSSGMDSVVSGLSWMCLAGNDVGSEGESPSPTSVMDSGRVEGNSDRVVLPKSISVRSTGYLKSSVQATGGSNNISSSSGIGVGVNKVLKSSNKICNDAQRVYVRGGKKEEQPMELEVYNQGMFKTELCNKWQDTGACPYGDHCQFAHGIHELRPVIRHPRYKTEVCRMVLNGDHCPYGHRCHFRHSLTDREKLIRSINLRSFKGLQYP